MYGQYAIQNARSWLSIRKGKLDQTYTAREADEIRLNTRLCTYRGYRLPQQNVKTAEDIEK